MDRAGAANAADAVRQSTLVAWDWSPDGKRVIGNLSGPPSVVAMYSFETKQYEKLAEFASNAMWLPDSTRFVFIFDKKIYLGDVKTRRVREIFSSGENEIRSVDISADGKLLYYSVYSSESDIWLLDFTGFQDLRDLQENVTTAKEMSKSKKTWKTNFVNAQRVGNSEERCRHA